MNTVTQNPVTITLKCRICSGSFQAERRSRKFCSSPCRQKAYRKRARRSVHARSDSVEWSTPQDLYDELNQEFGFTLDVAATPENAKCERYFTRKDDGLSQSWAGNVCWMNPPYGREIGRWMRKAFQESREATVVCLVPARPDTRWWHDSATQGEIRFLRGRLKFGGCKNAAPFPSAIVVFSKDNHVTLNEL